MAFLHRLSVLRVTHGLQVTIGLGSKPAGRQAEILQATP